MDPKPQVFKIFKKSYDMLRSRVATFPQNSLPAPHRHHQNANKYQHLPPTVTHYWGIPGQNDQKIQKLQAGIAKHCLGSKIVDIHVCNFNNEICFTTKVPLQVASAPYMMHPTTHRHHRNTPATAFELRSLNCNSVTDLASLAKGTAILTHRID